jgi:hypothetical protein
MRTTPWMEDGCVDAGGRATPGAVAEAGSRPEQRLRSGVFLGARFTRKRRKNRDQINALFAIARRASVDKVGEPTASGPNIDGTRSA